MGQLEAGYVSWEVSYILELIGLLLVIMESSLHNAQLVLNK